VNDNINQRLEALNIQLPALPEPVANYVPAVVSDHLIFFSGQTPKDGSRVCYAGKLGKDLTVEQGIAAAELCALRLLSVLQAFTHDLAQVERIVKLTAFVNASDDFTQHPQVVNGASDLLVKIFGERGQHARSAVGVSSLPSGAAVEIELIVRLFKN